MKIRDSVLVMAIFLVALAPGSSAATTYNWFGGTGNWSTNTNWDPTGIPSGNNTDTAVVNSGTSNLTGSSSANRLVIGTGGEVRATAAPMQFTFTKKLSGDPNPTMLNDGIFRLSNTGGNASIYASYSLAISGSGSLIMESSANSSISSGSSASITNSLGHTIQGVGRIEASLANYGAIHSTGDRLLMLGNFYNYTGGVLSSGPGAVLQMGIWNTPTSGLFFNYDGRGGWLDLNGGTLRVDNAGFKNANIRNSGGAGATMEILPAAGSVSFDGNTTVGTGALLNFNNAQMSASKIGSGPSPVITNDGVINFNATGGSYSYLTSADGTLTGSGRLVLNGSSYQYARVMGGSTTSLTNDVNHTIEGSGTLSGRITNNGTILANNSRLYIDAPISGNGTIKAENGGQLYIRTDYSTPRTVSAGDLILAQDSSLTVYGGTIYSTSGLLTVDVHGDFTNHLTDPTRWSWVKDTNTKLKMSGPAPEWHFLEVAGRTDLGSNSLVNNFALRTLDIAGNIALADFFDNQPGFAGHEALYVEYLTFSGSTLNLNGLELYVKQLDGTFDLVEAGDFEGKVINSPVPLPPSALLLGSGLAGLLALRGWRTRRRG